MRIVSFMQSKSSDLILLFGQLLFQKFSQVDIVPYRKATAMMRRFVSHCGETDPETVLRFWMEHFYEFNDEPYPKLSMLGTDAYAEFLLRHYASQQ